MFLRKGAQSEGVRAVVADFALTTRKMRVRCLIGGINLERQNRPKKPHVLCSCDGSVCVEVSRANHMAYRSQRVVHSLTKLLQFIMELHHYVIKL